MKLSSLVPLLLLWNPMVVSVWGADDTIRGVGPPSGDTTFVEELSAPSSSPAPSTSIQPSIVPSVKPSSVPITLITDTVGFEQAVRAASTDPENPSTLHVDVNVEIDFDDADDPVGASGLVLSNKFFHAICVGYDNANKCILKRSGVNGRFFRTTQGRLGVSFTGFKFVGGKAPQQLSTGSFREGGAFFLYVDERGCAATFVDCVFQDNFARDRGGAISLLSRQSSSLSFTGCTFISNTVSNPNEERGGGAIRAVATNSLNAIVDLVIVGSSFDTNDAKGNGNDILVQSVRGQVVLSCSTTSTSGTDNDVVSIGSQGPQTCSSTGVPSSAPSNSLLPSSTPTTSSSPSISGAPSNSGYPSASPSTSPSSSPTTLWEEITFDDFEDSNGNFDRKKSPNTERVTDRNKRKKDYIPDGTACLLIKDDQGKKSAYWLKENHDVRDYSNLRVSFLYTAQNMGRNEYFVLEYSSDGGESWKIMKRFRNNVAFTNGVEENSATVDFNNRNKTYSFTRKAKIRFRNRASGDGDRIYLDNVLFEGYLTTN